MQMGGRGAVADVAAGVMDNLIAVRPPRHLQPPQPLAAIRAVMWVIGTMVIYTFRYLQVPLDGLCAIYILLFEQPSPCMAHGWRGGDFNS